MIYITRATRIFTCNSLIVFLITMNMIVVVVEVFVFVVHPSREQLYAGSQIVRVCSFPGDTDGMYTKVTSSS